MDHLAVNHVLSIKTKESSAGQTLLKAVKGLIQKVFLAGRMTNNHIFIIHINAGQFFELQPDILLSLFYYKSGAIAHIFSSIVTESPREGHIMGTKGSIFLHPQWHKTQQLTLKLNSGEVTSFPFPHSGNGFEFQVEEVARCIAAKQLECELMPLSMSLLMAETHDEIRRQGGVKYSVD